MNTIYLIVSWDEGMESVKRMHDAHEAIEYLKVIQGYCTAYLYRCDESGAMVRLDQDF